MDAEGNVYVIEERRRVQKLDRSGAPLAAWGGAGEADGLFFDPIALTTDAAGRVYVADAYSRQPRIQAFDAQGTLLRVWRSGEGGVGRLRFPSGLAVDAQGHLYVTDLQHDRVHKLAPSAGR